MINLQKEKEYTRKLFSANWIKWVHEGTKPAETYDEKKTNALVGAVSKHCAKCLNLNGSCFVSTQSPSQPLHPNCHCYTVDVPFIEVKAECFLEKFTKYVFIASLINDKKQLFELLGYDIMDSEYLQQEFIKQAYMSYSAGDYELGTLNEYGQRINIVITLKRKDKNEQVSFRSGWMVYPNGKIILITPYGRR